MVLVVFTVRRYAKRCIAAASRLSVRLWRWVRLSWLEYFQSNFTAG